MDIVLCIDVTSSMRSSYKETVAMALSIASTALGFNCVVRIGIITFRSRQDCPMVVTYGFDRNIDTIKDRLDKEQPVERNRDGYEAIGDGLHEALDMKWRFNKIKGKSTPKLLILITDAAPNGLFTPLTGQDPWVMSKELATKDVTLAVVGMGSAIECDDFYSALAQNTGGAYIPLINAQRILQFVIQFVIGEETTFTDAFGAVPQEAIEENSSFKYSYMKDRVDGMIKECETMHDIRRFFERRSEFQ